MKSESFFIALIVAIIVIFEAIKNITIPLIQYYWSKYQHYKMIENRRKRFYAELRILMAD